MNTYAGSAKPVAGRAEWRARSTIAGCCLGVELISLRGLNSRSKGSHMLSRFSPRLTYANVAATLALVLAMGGSGYAAINSIPGPGGLIHGCDGKHGGSPASCGRWRAMLKEREGDRFQPARPDRAERRLPGINQHSRRAVTVTLAVPAGSYAVVAKALGSSDPTTGSAPGGAECVLSVPGGSDDDFSVNAIPANGVSSFANTIAFTSAARGTIEYKCDGSGGTPPTRGFYQARIVATRVGAVH